jgi:hypothetical protein
MKITILDFERSKQLEFTTRAKAKEYCDSIGWGWEYLTRYVNDWSMKNDEKYNEWLETNCHNSIMIVPTNAIYNKYDLFDMIVYWHEQIAFGSFGNESVDFGFVTPELNKAWVWFCTDKWLKENIKLDINDSWDWHDGCNHELDEDGELTEQGEKDLVDCEDYQLDQYCYESQGGYRGMERITSREIKDYLLKKDS